MDSKRRCDWVSLDDPLYLRYHDEEWGVPLHDERGLFELLTLEGAQAGLSWSTVLKKRENYRTAFADFDAKKVARFDERKVSSLMLDPGIVRNGLKVRSAILNANALLRVRKEFGSFDSYVWRFVGSEPKLNGWRTIKEIPPFSSESEAMSKDLVKRGFRFVGPTICYAYMQAAGMVNDHIVSCFRYKDLATTR